MISARPLSAIQGASVTAGVVLLLLIAVAPALAVEKLATLNYRILPEASGIAVSRIDGERLWFINDSGNRAELIAYDLATESYTRVKIRDVKNRDWEDLAAFNHRGQAWLAIGDVGDNKGKRDKVRVHLLREPQPGVTRASISTTLKISYPKGPRDVESIAIDEANRALYLLSKRESSPRLYRVQLPDTLEDGEYKLEAEWLGKVKSIPKPDEAEKKKFKHGKYRAQPTAMTLLPDGSAIALMTYRGAYLARLDADRDWLVALNESLCPVATPPLDQAETIAADAQGRLYVTSEGRDAPLIRMQASCAH